MQSKRFIDWAKVFTGQIVLQFIEINLGGVMALSGRSFTAINDFSKDEWLEVLDKAQEIKSQGVSAYGKVLEGKVIASLFFEASTRTRLSFETAIQRPGRLSDRIFRCIQH
jgi:hypothetical protein